MKTMHFSLLAIAAVACSALAQEVPKEISGRWSWPARNVSQTFSLEDIQRKGEGMFAAKLTWWTINPSCAIRDAAIEGRLTATGLSFDATTKCNDSFSVELTRSNSGWKGTGTNKGSSGVVVEIAAK